MAKIQSVAEMMRDIELRHRFGFMGEVTWTNEHLQGRKEGLRFVIDELGPVLATQLMIEAIKEKRDEDCSK
jgi:hypothetical protein